MDQFHPVGAVFHLSPVHDADTTGEHRHAAGDRGGTHHGRAPHRLLEPAGPWQPAVAPRRVDDVRGRDDAFPAVRLPHLHVDGEGVRGPAVAPGVVCAGQVGLRRHHPGGPSRAAAGRRLPPRSDRRLARGRQGHTRRTEETVLRRRHGRIHRAGPHEKHTAPEEQGDEG